jgi:hypothetical protein
MGVCKGREHYAFNRVVQYPDIVHGWDVTHRFECKICDDCGHWLPLGPANHGGEFAAQVAVEIRATELADAWRPIGGIRKAKPTHNECEGWSGWPHRHPLGVEQETGFLAAQIRNHERDIGDVNWAGQHMADHATHDAKGGE